MTEITFNAYEAEEGGYYASAVEASIFTEAETWDELQLMIKDAIDCHFDDEESKPKQIYLHLNHNQSAYLTS